MTEPRRENADAGRVLGTAVRRSWYVIVLAGAVASGAATLGASRQPVHYTAESRVLLGSLDPGTQSVPGYTTALNSLAGTYARVGATSVVADPTRAALVAEGIANPPSYTMSPIPDTPILRIEAKSTRSGDAVSTVKAAAAQMVAYVGTTNDKQAQVDAATKALHDAQVAVATAAVTLKSRQDAYALTPVDQQPALQPDLISAMADSATDAQAVTAATAALTAATTAQRNALVITTISSGAVASNDRSANMSRAALAGLVIGLVPGLAVAVAINRPRRTAPATRHGRQVTTVDPTTPPSTVVLPGHALSGASSGSAGSGRA